MTLPKIVTFNGKKYTWDGSGWCGTEDNLVPPQAIVNNLDSLFAARLAEEERRRCQTNARLIKCRQCKKVTTDYYPTGRCALCHESFFGSSRYRNSFSGSGPSRGASRRRS